MSRKTLRNICLIILIWFLPVSAFGLTLAQAVNKAKRNNAKVLSAQTVIKGKARVHHIKILTRNGVVRTVRYADHSYNPKPKTKPKR